MSESGVFAAVVGRGNLTPSATKQSWQAEVARNVFGCATQSGEEKQKKGKRES